MKRKASLVMMGTLALGLLGGTAAVAQDRGGWWGNNGYGYYDRDDDRGRARYGFDVGFREGQEAGAKDAAHRERFRPTEHGAFRSADDGYRGGSKHEYREAFRAGYMRGYRQAYANTMERFRPYGSYDPYGHHRDGDGDWDDR